MTPKYFIGIDPGLSGGLALIINRRKLESSLVNLVPMPATEQGVWEWFEDFKLADPKDVFVMLEKVGGYVPSHRPTGENKFGQPGSAMFKFGMSYGALRMAVVAAGHKVLEVTPQKWQAAMGVPKKGKHTPKNVHKNNIKAMAQQLFLSKKGITQKTADALMIAVYCRSLYMEGR